MIVETEQQYKEALEVLLKHDVWTVDVETNGLDAFGMNQLFGVGVGISNGPDIQTFYFPFRHQRGGNLPYKLLTDLLSHMSKVKSLIGYNIKFDLRFLEKDGLDITNTDLLDVVVMVRLTTHTSIRNLKLTDAITRAYGKEYASYDSDTKKMLRSKGWNKDFSLAGHNIIGDYCALDVYYTQKLHDDLLPIIESTKQQEVWQLEIGLTKVLYNMERQGISVDSAYAYNCINKINDRRLELEKQIYEIANREFNINSTHDIAEVFHSLGINSEVTTETGKESWSAYALATINHPLSGLIRQHRALLKLSSTYLEPYKDKDKLNTSFCHWGTVTGRLSSREPNLQNIPRNYFNLADRKLSSEDRDTIRGRIDAMVANDVSFLSDDVVDTWSFMGDESYDEDDPYQLSIRRLFVPRDGYRLVSFDYSQMEVRVFLSYLQNKEIQELLDSSTVDFHAEAAKIAFDIHEDHAEFKYYRQLAKGINFGVIYGIGAESLARELNTTQSQAKDYKKRYLENMVGSNQFINGVRKAIKERGWVRNRYGRVYQIESEGSYKGVNYLVQGTSADLLNSRLIEVDKYLEGTPNKLLLQVHDEIICEIRDEDMEDAIEDIRNILQANELNIPLFVDVEIGNPSWANKIDYKKWVANSEKGDILAPSNNMEETQMAKISQHLGVTVQIGVNGSNQYARLDCTMTDIDTEQPIEPQIEQCKEALEKVFWANKEELGRKVKSMQNKESRPE